MSHVIEDGSLIKIKLPLSSHWPIHARVRVSPNSQPHPLTDPSLLASVLPQSAPSSYKSALYRCPQESSPPLSQVYLDKLRLSSSPRRWLMKEASRGLFPLSESFSAAPSIPRRSMKPSSRAGSFKLSRKLFSWTMVFSLPLHFTGRQRFCSPQWTLGGRGCRPLHRALDAYLLPIAGGIAGGRGVDVPPPTSSIWTRLALQLIVARIGKAGLSWWIHWGTV